MKPTDLSAMILAGSTLLFMTVIAAIVPAWKATRADPVQALSGEKGAGAHDWVNIV